MRYKILLFLCLLLVCTTLVSATEYDNKTSTPDNTLETHTNNNVELVKTDQKTNIKSTPPSAASIDDHEAECYYGGRITYNLQSQDNDYVDEGKVDLYVNNTKVATKNEDGYPAFDWMYDNEITLLDAYPSGEYPLQIKYTNNNQTIESNTATLTIHPGQVCVYAKEITVKDQKIIVPVDVISSATYTPITHGTLTATHNNQQITQIACNNENLELTIPAKYQQETIQITYSDNREYLEDYTENVFLDVIIAGTGSIKTTLSVNSMQLVNVTHTEYDETVIEDLGIEVLVDVTSNTDKITRGYLTAYYNSQQIASSNNATSIIIPAKYNLEEINLKYTPTEDYSNSTLLFTLMTDKINTKSYISYISTPKNSITNIYPSITSNYPFIYGQINVYVDGNLVKTINAEDSHISIANGKSTVYSTLDVTGLSEGEYELTIEVEENNLYTESQYTTRLTINKVSTYISAYDRTIYVGDNTTLYARVYANNRATINTGQISFTIDDELISTEYVNNNTASIEYIIPSTLTEGKHNLLITYEGDDTYNTTSKQVTLTLTKSSTTTTLRTGTVNDEKIQLNTTIRAWNKNINEGNITVYIDDTIVATGEVRDNSSTILLPKSIVTDKKYKLKLVYGGTDLLNSSTCEYEEFIFNRKNTTSRVYPYLRTNGTCTLTGYVYTENYAKVNTGNMIFTINGKQVATAKVENNKAATTYDMSEYDAGNYTITATYNGSTLYKTSTNNSIVTKNPYYHKTYMNIQNKTLEVKRGGSTDINATITSYTRNITENINARIILNATWGTEVYTQDVTFINGKLNTKLTIPEDFHLFTFYGEEITKYTLIIQSEQSKNFKATSQTGTVSIGEATKLYQKALWGYKEANVTFNTTLQNTAGNKINTNTTARIDIYTIDGKQLIPSINTQIVNGQLSYVYKLPSNMTDEKYLVNITAKSNKDYAASYKTVNMTLNNRRTYISAANTKGYIANTLILNGTITDSITKTKANTNAEVDILIDGKKLTTVQANKGVFKYTITNNLTAGIHNVTYNYKGDTIYANSTRILNITSNKNTIRITTTSITAKVGDSINIKANITDTKGQPVTDTLKVNIQLNGKTIASNLEVTNGKLRYSYNIPSDTASNSKITITVQETSKYNTRNASTTLKVNKDYQFITLTQTTIMTSKGSKISISGNITDKNRNLLAGTKLNIKIGGVDIANITSKDGKFNYEYTVTQNKGTYDVTVKALESNGYLYNAKHMSLKVNN